MLSVACVKTGTKYAATYVNKLAVGVLSNLSDIKRVGFICATDDRAGINSGIIQTIPLSDPHLPGWWSKLSLFRPKGAFGQIKGRVLFLDLDTIITGSLDDLVNYPSDFVMMHDPMRPWKPASGVMLLEAGSRPWIWEYFQRNPEQLMRNHHGDQDVIYEAMEVNCRYNGKGQKPYADLFPQQFIKSYKLDAIDGPPEGCRIVAFHGEPRPHQVTSGWVKESWL